MTDDVDEIEEQELDAAAVQRLLQNYRAAEAGEAREARWRAFSAAEREALQGIGVTGPLVAREGDDEPLKLDGDALRMMDPEARREAKAEFEKVSKRAEGDFRRGLGRLMSGDLDASQETLDKVAQIRDQADNTSDPNERGVLFQRGAQLIQSLNGPDTSRAFNPAQVSKRRQFFDGLTRRQMVTETDVHGHERTFQLDREVSPEQFKDTRPDPFPDEAASIEEYLAWPKEKRLRYVKERPDDYRALLAAADR